MKYQEFKELILKLEIENIELDKETNLKEAAILGQLMAEKAETFYRRTRVKLALRNLIEEEVEKQKEQNQ